MKIKSVLSKLIRYPHGAVFDKSPDAGVAFHINHPDGLIWSIVDEVLTVKMPSVTTEYHLSRYTIGSLIAALQYDGVQVAKPSAYFFGRSSRVLLDGNGDASKPGGDALLGFKSDLWVTFAAFAAELRLAKLQVTEALKQMIITQAEGEWLDLWGSLYDVQRLPGEPDSDYQKRIPEEAFRLRVNKFAIEKAILDITGNRIHLREAWSRMFRLDSSRMSGTHRLVSGEEWRYGYIQPYAKGLFDWGNALEVIERNKAAGVIVFQPVAEIDRYVDAHLDGTISFGVAATAGAWVRPTFDFRLDYLQLSQTQPHRNWTASILSVMGLMNISKTGSWESKGGGWSKQPWGHWTEYITLDGSTSFSRITTTEWVQRRTWNGGSWRNWGE